MHNFHVQLLAGTRTPAKTYLVCLVSGKQRDPEKAKRRANSGEELGFSWGRYFDGFWEV